MQTKPLLYGLIGFIIGGFVVSVAATFEKNNNTDSTNSSEMTMSEMVSFLSDKKGDDYDEAFISEMIDHHQSAVDMAKLSAANAKHDEIKKLSNNIVVAQESEISQMRQWQLDWGYHTQAEHDQTSH